MSNQIRPTWGLKSPRIRGPFNSLSLANSNLTWTWDSPENRLPPKMNAPIMSPTMKTTMTVTGLALLKARSITEGYFQTDVNFWLAFDARIKERYQISLSQTFEKKMIGNRLSSGQSCWSFKEIPHLKDFYFLSMFNKISSIIYFRQIKWKPKMSASNYEFDCI